MEVIVKIGECWDLLDWSIIAGIAAAASAVFAGYHICQDRKWRRLDRTFSHSPYRNEKFLEAIDNLKKNCDCFKDRQSTQQAPELVCKLLVNDLVYAANLWGQMAMEHEKGLLDKKIAKDLLQKNYCKFCHTFEKWLGSSNRDDTYLVTLSLYEKWKSN